MGLAGAPCGIGRGATVVTGAGGGTFAAGSPALGRDTTGVCAAGGVAGGCGGSTGRVVVTGALTTVAAGAGVTSMGLGGVGATGGFTIIGARTLTGVATAATTGGVWTICGGRGCGVIAGTGNTVRGSAARGSGAFGAITTGGGRAGEGFGVATGPAVAAGSDPVGRDGTWPGPSSARRNLADASSSRVASGGGDGRTGGVTRAVGADGTGMAAGPRKGGATGTAGAAVGTGDCGGGSSVSARRNPSRGAGGGVAGAGLRAIVSGAGGGLIAGATGAGATEAGVGTEVDTGWAAGALDAGAIGRLGAGARATPSAPTALSIASVSLERPACRERRSTHANMQPAK